MKTTKSKIRCGGMSAILVLALGLMVCLPELAGAAPMGTAWTYQGRLLDANNTADGLYDFEFKLYDDPCTGTQQASTIDVNDLDVIDGYFTVELDFGSGIFDGDARWLETAVRPGDSTDPDAFVTLSPRTELTPTPYAMQASGLTLPYSGTVSSAASAFLVRNTGPGKAIQGIGQNNDGVTGGSYAAGRSGVFGYNDDADGFGVFGSSVNGIGVKGYTFGDGSAGVFEIENPSNTSTALYATTTGEGDAGHFFINNASSIASSVYAVTIGDGNAVNALSTGLSGTGVYGFASNDGDGMNYGGYFKAAASRGRGIYAEATYPGEETSEITYGGYFKSASRHGAGVFGLTTHSYGGKGVFGYASGEAGIGVYGQTSGSINAGVFGTCINESAGKGVVGTSTANLGIGVMGWAYDDGDYENYGGYFEADGTYGRGVYGNATGSDGVGIYGEATRGGKAGHFEGDVHVTGELTRAYTAGTGNLATPIAYAFIRSNGTKASGTPNVSCTWNSGSQRYEITISGENYYYNDYVTVVTLSGIVGVAKTGSVGDKLLVYIYNLSSTLTQSDFQFVTYKP